MADGHELSELGRNFVAGLLAGLRDMTLFYAPNINSYKRYVPGSFAPTAVTWGRDNRTCSLRLVGHGPSLRIENRVPGGDVNPGAGGHDCLRHTWHGQQAYAGRALRRQCL